MKLVPYTVTRFITLQTTIEALSGQEAIDRAAMIPDYIWAKIGDDCAASERKPVEAADA